MSRRARVVARWSLCLLALGALVAAVGPAHRADAAAALTICTAIPREVPQGTPFTYTVTNTASGASNDVVVPGGGCRTFPDLAGGASFTVREQVPPGFRLVDIIIDSPTVSRVSTDLAQATVAFTIADGGSVQVDFVNVTAGSVRICREGGVELDPVAQFRFEILNEPTGRSVTSIPIVVGECVFIDSQSLANAVGVGPGPYTIREVPPPGIAATSIAVTGPGVSEVRADPARGEATFRLAATGAATVLFTNGLAPPSAVTCADFATPEDAQAFLDADPSDPFGIDLDGDYVACNHSMAMAGPAPMEERTNRARPLSRTVCPPSHPIKGNRTSAGELIYHVPGGASYAQTEAEECFATEDDAVRAGYRRALR
jgi:hypothetical protein